MVELDKIWLTDDAVYIRSKDGSIAKERFADYPRLSGASEEQLRNYTVDRFGVHWPDLDEDLEFESFFKSKDANPLYSLFIAHPELNASAIARRLGISQSLFAQYISGIKKPSRERLEQILGCIRQIGSDLQNIHL